MGFYAYLWLREDGTPYYAGKGIGRRGFTNKGHRVHRPVSIDKILIFPRATEAEAFETEKELIRNWGRKDIGTGCLQNQTDGGENPPSWRGRKRGRPTLAHRQKISESKKGTLIRHPNYALSVLRGNQFARGLKHTAEWKAARSAQQKAYWVEWRRQRVAIS